MSAAPHTYYLAIDAKSIEWAATTEEGLLTVLPYLNGYEYEDAVHRSLLGVVYRRVICPAPVYSGCFSGVNWAEEGLA